jgi:hypothetical protein
MNKMSLNGWLIGLAVAAAVGTGIRISNALTYPIDMGFDAIGNWEYVALLLRDWTLPSPDAGWSTAHPPFFYNFAAAIVRIFDAVNKPSAVHVIRLATACAGLVGIAAAVQLVRKLDPQNSRRAFIAGVLLLFLPVHLYMSAMLSEEILVTALVSIAAAGLAWEMSAGAASGRKLVRAGIFGAFAGLALLTKLSGLLIVGIGSAAYLIHGWQSGDRMAALRSCLIFGTTASLFGGWYYLWNLYAYGYLYPHGLEVHAVMFQMPPGVRGFFDYLWIPVATFADPQLLSPKLLHSIWGSTYVTIWFDGHRSFLPRDSISVTRLGTAMLCLALVPTAAFFVGLSRGARRWMRDASGSDLVLVSLVVATLLGYVVFTWQNPWFAVLKGSFLLGLSVPFSFYASEVLADWTRDRSFRSATVLACLGLLAVLSIGAFTYGVVFSKLEIPGLEWQLLEMSWQG